MTERKWQHVLRDENERWTNTPNAGAEVLSKSVNWLDAGTGIVSSLGGNTIFDWRYRSQVHPEREPEEKMGHPVKLSSYAFSEKTIENIFAVIPVGYKGQVVVEHDRFNGIVVKGEYMLSTSNERAIAIVFRLVRGRLVVLELFAYLIDRDDLADFGDVFMRQFVAILREAGIEDICLQAGMNIGRYAFAMQGFRYFDPAECLVRLNRLSRWYEQKTGDVLAGEYRKQLTTPKDFATLDVPGVTISGINNPDMDGEHLVGKAFMLDLDGHGEWDAIYAILEPSTEGMGYPAAVGYRKPRFVRHAVTWLSGRHTVAVANSRFISEGFSDYLVWLDWLRGDV